MVVFVLAMMAVVFAGACLLAYRMLEVWRLRKTFSGNTVVIGRLCHGGSFDFYELLRACRLSPRTRNVVLGDDCYVATFGKKGRIRLTLRMVGDRYVLEKVERYYDKNWQFTGWFDDYRWQDDKTSLCYVVIGERNGAEAGKKHRLPSFELTKVGAEQLTKSFAKH